MEQQLQLETIGIDAEMFLRKKKTGEIISAEGLVQGSKHNPFRWDALEQWFTTQLDNVLAEFTIPPEKTPEDFAASIKRAMDYLRSSLPDDVEPVIQASANLDEKWLQTEQAQMFGCDPDFNAYTGHINTKPYCEDVTLRSCGAHIHLGYKGVEVKYDDNIFDYAVDKQRAGIVQLLDLFVSIPLVLMEPESERKRLYGKAGAFRPKSYGLEYRTTSSWYLSSAELQKWVFNSSTQAFNHFATHGILDQGLAQHVEQVINTNNHKAAKDLVKDFKLQLV